MSLHRLRSITIGVPDVGRRARLLPRLRSRRDAPGRFETADGGEQLRIEPAPRRALLALAVGVDDADDLGRAAAALAKLGNRGRARRARAARRRAGDRRARRARGRAAHRAEAAAAAPDQRAGPRRCAWTRARRRCCPPRPRGRASSRTSVIGSPDAAARGASSSRARLPRQRRGARDRRQLPALLDRSPQPARAAGPVSFLHHTAWEMDDVDAVGRAAAAMLAADPARHVWGLGRHGIGSNYFWYLRDPAGQLRRVLERPRRDRRRRGLERGGVHAARTRSRPGARPYRGVLAPDDIVALARGME